jgi:hypothetical protein
MRIRIRHAILGLALAANALAMGSASARWPVLGEEWADWTRYDSSHQAIGGGRINCDGSIQTWGDAGSPTGLALHPC